MLLVCGQVLRCHNIIMQAWKAQARPVPQPHQFKFPGSAPDTVATQFHTDPRNNVK